MRKIKTILLVILIFLSSMLFTSCEAITAQNIIYNKTSDINGNQQRNNPPAMNGNQNINNRPVIDNNSNIINRPGMNVNPVTKIKG